MQGKFYVILRDKLNYNVNKIIYGFSGLADCRGWLYANYKIHINETTYPEFVISKDKKGYIQTYNVYIYDDSGIKLRVHYNGV